MNLNQRSKSVGRFGRTKRCYFVLPTDEICLFSVECAIQHHLLAITGANISPDHANIEGPQPARYHGDD